MAHLVQWEARERRSPSAGRASRMTRFGRGEIRAVYRSIASVLISLTTTVILRWLLQEFFIPPSDGGLKGRHFETVKTNIEAAVTQTLKDVLVAPIWRRTSLGRNSVNGVRDPKRAYFENF